MIEHQEEALRLAEKFAIGLCKERDYPREDWNDCLQEGKLAALEALPRWRPASGALTTFLYRRVRGAILNHRAKHANGGMGSKHVSVHLVSLQDQVPGAEDFDGDPLTYEDITAYVDPPAGYGDPLDELIQAEETASLQPEDDVATLLARLTPAERKLLTREYGLGGFKSPTQQAMADEAGISQPALRTRITRALRKAKKLSEGEL